MRAPAEVARRPPSAGPACSLRGTAPTASGMMAVMPVNHAHTGVEFTAQRCFEPRPMRCCESSSDALFRM